MPDDKPELNVYAGMTQQTEREALEASMARFLKRRVERIFADESDDASTSDYPPYCDPHSEQRRLQQLDDADTSGEYPKWQAETHNFNDPPQMTIAEAVKRQKEIRNYQWEREWAKLPWYVRLWRRVRAWRINWRELW